MKVYIAQPMQNVPDFAIEERRRLAEDYIRIKHGSVEFVNNFRPEWGTDYIPPLEALGKALELLAHSDIAYFLPGWEDSRGCSIEAECCTMYGVPMAMIPMQDWDDIREDQ